MPTARAQQHHHAAGAGGGVYVSKSVIVLFSLGLGALLILQLGSLSMGPYAAVRLAFTPSSSTTTQQYPTAPVLRAGTKEVSAHTVNSYQQHHASALTTSSSSSSDNDQCRFYLAESAIPNGGLGIFAGIGLHPGDTVAFPDICLFVADMQAPVEQWMQMRTHTWGKANFFGQHEGETSRGACPGIATTLNTMPDHMINTELVSPAIPTNAGLDRAHHPGAGSITHHFGMHGKALDVVTVGSELTIYYGDWTFDRNKEYVKPERPVSWLQKHGTSLSVFFSCVFVDTCYSRSHYCHAILFFKGWCIDNIEIRIATDPRMGRGAFARRSLVQNQVVAPAPLQSFPDRAVFQDKHPEQLYVNYCFQPKDSTMLFFPYGQGVSLINHSNKPNVYLRWSDNPLHHGSWLELDWEDYWKNSYSGAIILEIVALRDIAPGEELFLDYGRDWENAWNQHVQAWQPPPGADQYVYPADMDETAPLRTIQEQQTDPYPNNLITMCQTPDWSARRSNRTIEWYDAGRNWWRGMTYCHVLERETGYNGDYVYTVALIFDHRPQELEFSALTQTPRREWYIDIKVPRRAIRFIEKPYMDDEHLPNAFRHPIQLPDNLVPKAWKNLL